MMNFNKALLNAFKFFYEVIKTKVTKKYAKENLSFLPGLFYLAFHGSEIADTLNWVCLEVVN